MPATKLSPKIMFWNAQSITNKYKQIQLEHLIQNQHIDIVLLVETFLKQHHTFQLKNFAIYRNDRLTHPHGGVAIAVRNGIPHKVRTHFLTNHIENIAIEIAINNIPTCITAAYSPKYSIHFANDIETLTSVNMQYMVFGDFNAKHTSWNCNNNNKSGNLLFGMQQASNFMIFHPPDHTHFPHSGQSPSTIDLLLSNVNFVFDIITYTDQISSDHSPVLYNGFCDCSSRKSFDYSKADWRKYHRLIENNINDIEISDSIMAIDIAFTKFTELIINARTASVPTKEIQAKTKISAETKKLIQFKNKLRRIWQRTSSIATKQLLKTELNKIQIVIHQMVKKDVNAHWNKQLRKMDKGNKKVWNIAKQIRGKKDSSFSKIKWPTGY